MNTFVLLDKDGFELAVDREITISEGKATAKRLLAADSEYGDAYKAEIRDKAGECIWEAFRTSGYPKL